MILVNGNNITMRLLKRKRNDNKTAVRIVTHIVNYRVKVGRVTGDLNIRNQYYPGRCPCFLYSALSGLG